MYTIGSIRIIPSGREALVERLGRYHRTLKLGINFIVPILDSVVLVDSVEEQFIELEEQYFFTDDNVALEVGAAIYWRILDLHLAYYNVEDVVKTIAWRGSDRTTPFVTSERACTRYPWRVCKKSF